MGAAEPPKVWAGHCICNLSSTLLPRHEPVSVTVRLRRWAVAAFDLPLSKGAPVFGAGAGPAMGRGAGSGRPRCGLGYRRLGCPPLRFSSQFGFKIDKKGNMIGFPNVTINNK